MSSTVAPESNAVELAIPAPTTPKNRDAGAFFNRELSWLKFNERVLEEALDESTPLLERVNFLSIFGSNLDEFFMIRVSGLRRQMQAGVIEAPADGMSPAEQLLAVREQLLPTLQLSHMSWLNDLWVKLKDVGIHVMSYSDLKKKQRRLLRAYFQSEIFPVLTPLASDPGHPFPHISNLSINLAVVVKDGDEERFARLKVPQSFPRLLRIPDEEGAASMEKLGLADVSAPNFVWLEEVISANLDMLFPGVEVKAAYAFRITRDADMDIEEDEAADLMMAMSEYVEQRRFGTAIRLEIDEGMPAHVEELIVQNLRLAPFQVYRTAGPIGLADLRELAKVDRPELKYAPFLPAPRMTPDENVFSALRRRNVLLFHPFDSFSPVVTFIREAAVDPQVLAIKATLYRVGSNSPVVEALMRARENGKQVAVLVELKARFDEENNITWARALEAAGVHVVYGVVGLKTHCKVCLVVRRERDGIRRYVHVATGNYNPITARIYTDIGMFTTDPDIAEDISDLFNTLTGISHKKTYRKLLVAPASMRIGILSRIAREIEHHKKKGGGRLVFKCNSLTDRRCIEALYEASAAGVRVDLQIRGICCLRPGVPGLSENIDVTSIVGRFLEHSRIFYFENGGDHEIFIGSADLMGRNLDRRVEQMVPVDDKHLQVALRDVLFTHLRDTQKCRRLLPDGSWITVRAKVPELELSSQRHFVQHGGSWRGPARS